MKKKKCLFFIFLLSVLLTACSAGGQSSGNAGSQEADRSVMQEGEAEEKKQREAVGPAEQVTEGEETQGIPIRVFHGDSMAENICVNTVLTKEITPESLLLSLSSFQVIPDTVTAEKFRRNEDGEQVSLSLDLSEEFAQYLSSVGTAGESMTMGSVVNTFLDAYEAVSITITVEGETLSTGHAVYDSPLKMYPFLEASYQVETGVIEGEGISVSYPRLEGLSNSRLQEAWNHWTEEKAQQLADDTEEGGSVTASYEIKTMNDELLSVFVSGERYAPGASYPVRFAYTYNIDMGTGENVRLAHYADVEQIAVDMTEGRNYTVEGSLAGEFQQRLSILYGDEKQLAAVLRGFDFGGAQEVPAGYSYQEDGRTWLCMEVPHALGDYVLVGLD